MRKLDAADQRILEYMLAQPDRQAGILASFANYSAALVLFEGRDPSVKSVSITDGTAVLTAALREAYEDAVEDMKGWPRIQIERAMVLHAHFLKCSGVDLSVGGAAN